MRKVNVDAWLRGILIATLLSTAGGCATDHKSKTGTGAKPTEGSELSDGGSEIAERDNCEVPLTDRDGDGTLTQRDAYLRDYERMRKRRSVCALHYYDRDVQRMLFDFDDASLKPDAIKILDEAVEILKKYPELKTEVAGHSDSIGSSRYNQRLSFRRARAAYNYLVSKGISASSLVGPVGYGETRPIAPYTNDDGSDNPEGRAKNRRIELNVQN